MGGQPVGGQLVGGLDIVNEMLEDGPLKEALEVLSVGIGEAVHLHPAAVKVVTVDGGGQVQGVGEGQEIGEGAAGALPVHESPVARGVATVGGVVEVALREAQVGFVGELVGVTELEDKLVNHFCARGRAHIAL